MITLQFVSTADLGSDLIEYYDHGLYSHVDAVLPDGRLLGARQDGGVAIRPPNYEKFNRKLVVTLPCPAPISDAFYAFLDAQLGKPYDNSAIAGFAVGRDWRAPDSWFCSELDASALELAGFFAGPLSTPANKVAPDDLLLVLSAIVPIGVAG